MSEPPKFSKSPGAMTSFQYSPLRDIRDLAFEEGASSRTQPEMLVDGEWETRLIRLLPAIPEIALSSARYCTKYLNLLKEAMRPCHLSGKIHVASKAYTNNRLHHTEWLLFSSNTQSTSSSDPSARQILRSYIMG